jgi:hypothetical protein
MASLSFERKQFMNLFWAALRNMTAPRNFESAHKFKTLQLCTDGASRFGERQVVFVGSGAESFSLREIRLDVSLRAFAAPTALETSAD